MKAEIEALGFVREGVLMLRHKAWFDSQLPQFEGDVIVAVRRAGRPQSDAFRGWYYAEVLPAFAHYMREEGDGEATVETAHDALAHKFLPLGPCPITGAPRRRSTSAASMSAEAFRSFVSDQVLPFLIRDCGLEIHDPDPKRRSLKRVRELQHRDRLASRGASESI